MDNRTLQVLEFPKVLARLADLAVSEPGRAACLGLLPLAGGEAIAERGRRLAQAILLRRETGFRVGEFPPLEGLLAFVASPRNVLDLDALVALRAVLHQARTLREALSACQGESVADLCQLVAATPWPDKTAAALRRCLDPEGRLRDESSPDLALVRGQIRSINQACTKKVKEFIQDHGLSGFLQDDYFTISSDRFVVPLKANFKGRVPGIIHDYSQTGETCYFEPMFLVDLNNRLQELRREEREEERKVLAYLTELVRLENEALAATYDLLVEFDVLQAKVALAEKYDGHPLPVVEDGAVELRKARHPLLVLGGGQVVGLDLRLAEDEYALIISGGNAGGKTVCLKTLGLCALMAYAGLPVPAEPESRLPLWHDIFVFMGDEQSLEDAVSTFTAQIRGLARVWERIDARTLVILDEFGAGTDPAQGAALAQAVVDALMERRARVAAATHFPAVKAYGLTHAHVRSASVIFDPRTKRPLYSLAYDQAGASIALDVAREHGLPPEILSRAEQYLLLDGGDSSLLMNRLNELAVEREAELKKLARERAAFESQRKNLKVEFDKKKIELLDWVKARSQEIVREWQAGKVERKRALKALAETREKLVAEAPQETSEVLAPLAAGQRVQYRPWGKVGTILECDPRRGQCKVEVGGVSLWAAEQDLLPVAGERAKAGPVATAVGRTMPLTLDLRGLRADEALASLARSLDQALLQGAEHLEVIHGRGTGALRREIHAFLKTFPAVASFALANEDQGGDGKTVIQLS